VVDIASRGKEHSGLDTTRGIGAPETGDRELVDEAEDLRRGGRPGKSKA
jgi:hypothetical protein